MHPDRLTFFYDQKQEHIFKIVYDEIFIREDYSVPLKREDPIIIDCGANIGLASLYFAGKFPKAKILAFEPNPSAVVYFNKNTQILRQSGRLTFHQVALGKENKTGFFNATPQPGSVFASSVFNFHGPRVPVQFRKLSDFTAEYEYIDFVKIDIEGAEWDVLDDLILTDTLQKIDQLIVEHHQSYDTDDRSEEFIDLFKQNGFEVTIRSTFKTKPFACMVLHCHRS